MAERYVRAQILLEPEQRQALARIAQREHRSLSDVIREVIQQYLKGHEAEAQKQQGLEALERLSKLREKIHQRYGIYPGDPVAEARAEREAQLESVWHGHSSDLLQPRGCPHYSLALLGDGEPEISRLEGDGS